MNPIPVLLHMSSAAAFAVFALLLMYSAFLLLNKYVWPSLDFKEAVKNNNIAVGLVVAALIIGICLIVTSASAAETTRYDNHFKRVATVQWGDRQLWTVLKGQAFAESALREDVCSHAGACGLMQFMQPVALAFGLTDRFDAAASIWAGARLDSQLYRALTRDGGTFTDALRAYNLGIGNLRKRRGYPRVPEAVLPPETVEYPKRIAYAAARFGFIGDLDAVELSP